MPKKIQPFELNYAIVDEGSIFKPRYKRVDTWARSSEEIVQKLNEVIEVVNELKGEK